MKYLKILSLLVCVLFFTVESSYAQDAEQLNFQKITIDKTPQKVKEAALQFKGYKIKDAFVTSTTKKSKTLYKVVVYKRNSSFAVLVDNKGKIVKTLE